MSDHFYARAPVGSPGAMSIASYDATAVIFEVPVAKFSLKPIMENSASKALNTTYNPVTALTGYELEFTLPDLSFGLESLLLNIPIKHHTATSTEPSADKVVYPSKTCLRPVRILAFIPACNSADGSTSSRKIYIPYFLVKEITASTYAVGEQPERTVSGTLIFDTAIGGFYQDIQLNKELTAASDKIPASPEDWELATSGTEAVNFWV